MNNESPNSIHSQDEAYASLLKEFIHNTREELAERWDLWPKDMQHNETHEVIGGLLARQISLINQMAANPTCWNSHVAPLYLRAMADVHISLAWIIKNPNERAAKFIEYGLGQMKLNLEHTKQQARNAGVDPEQDKFIKEFEDYINSQKLIMLTEINFGNWSDLNTRKMADEANCKDLYNYTYTPFSATVHSTWQHILQNNLRTCNNPLHRFHRIPYDCDVQPNSYYFYLASRLLQRSFNVFDNTFGINITRRFAYSILHDKVVDLKKKQES